MSLVFDANAQSFARDIDTAIDHGCYRRGELFVQFANRTVSPGRSILDYGCGPGRISLMLARSGFEVLGVDPSSRMIVQAKEQDNQGLRVQFRVGDESILGLDSQGAIVCSSVIEYIHDPDKLLRAFHRSLCRDGILIISYSNKRSPCRQRAGLTDGKNPFADAYQQSWGWRGFKKLLTRNGFECVVGPKFFDFHWKVDRFVTWLPLGLLGIVAARKSLQAQI